MGQVVALISQNSMLVELMEKVANRFHLGLDVYEGCEAFVRALQEDQSGVAVVDASSCTQAGGADLQELLNEARRWRVVYLPKTNQKDEVKEAIGAGVFGCLHNPVKEPEVRQMLESALGI